MDHRQISLPIPQFLLTCDAKHQAPHLRLQLSVATVVMSLLLQPPRCLFLSPAFLFFCQVQQVPKRSPSSSQPQTPILSTSLRLLRISLKAITTIATFAVELESGSQPPRAHLSSVILLGENLWWRATRPDNFPTKLSLIISLSSTCTI